MAIDTIFIAAGGWLLQNYGKAAAEKITTVARNEWTARWEKFNWKKAAVEYEDKVVNLYGTLRILGASKPVKLEGLFTDVYILDKPTALQRFDLKQLKKKFSKDHRKIRLATITDQKRHEGLTLVSQPESHRLFVLGHPGAGKTTFLKYITLQAIEGKINKIPIFIPLKEWSDASLDLLPFIVEQFDICNFPEAQPFVKQLLQTGQAIVLFDALDEVNQEGGLRDKVIADLNDFSKKYDKSQCLITCRIAATEYSFERFTYVEMADFSDEQIRIFVKKWFRDKERQDKFFSEFFHLENAGLRELGRIPLLLSLLCLAFEETLTFPQRRVEIYEEAIDALLKKWDTARNIKRDEIYRKLSLGRKRQMFARIAAEAFENGEYFLRQRDLEKRIVSYLQKLPPADQAEDIDGEVVLKAIEAQHGIFVERAKQIHSFAHLTFQEYFTAKYIADNAEKGTTKRLIDDHLTDDRWEEVFLLTVSILDDADLFFTQFRQAIDSLVQVNETLVNLLRWAENRAAQIKAPYKPAVIRSILCSFALDRAVGPDLDLAPELDFDLDLALALDVEPDIVQDLVLNIDYAFNFDHHRDRTLFRAFNLARVLDRDLDRDFTLSRIHDIEEVFVSALLLIRDIALILDIDPNDIAIIPEFRHYLEANILLTKCLKLAYVSDRTEIENSLLLPPKV